MNLNHVAISVNSIEEINDFYVNILEMQLMRQFDLNKNLAFNIFGLDSDIPAYLLTRGNLTLEIFIAKRDTGVKINHICFSVQDREILYKKAQEKAFECIRIKRDTSDLIFIKDKTGNIFEIKNS